MSLSRISTGALRDEFMHKEVAKSKKVIKKRPVCITSEESPSEESRKVGDTLRLLTRVVAFRTIEESRDGPRLLERNGQPSRDPLNLLPTLKHPCKPGHPERSQRTRKSSLYPGPRQGAVSCQVSSLHSKERAREANPLISAGLPRSLPTFVAPLFQETGPNKPEADSHYIEPGAEAEAQVNWAYARIQGSEGHHPISRECPWAGWSIGAARVSKRLLRPTDPPLSTSSPPNKDEHPWVFDRASRDVRKDQLAFLIGWRGKVRERPVSTRRAPLDDPA